ncbi:winged helix-turn-helix domain-containing protein [Streptomyces collinus]|uniref:helix-turn-helix domain-containing protein n=1 Tax=Streptomyces collinus TaxID=42684 RepID=UPI003687C687
MDRFEGGHADRRERLHVSYSVSGATKLMHRLGFSPQVPARRAPSTTNMPSLSKLVRLASKNGSHTLTCQ